MACVQSRSYSYFGPYYPCSIFVGNTTCSETTVVNPEIVLNQAFLGLTTTTSVASGSAVPVSLISSRGEGFSVSGGVVTLGAGTYQVTYNVSSLISASGTNSFGLSLGGSTVPTSVSTTSGTTGDAISQSNTVIITLTQQQTLFLQNLSSDAVTVESANLLITRLS